MKKVRGLWNSALAGLALSVLACQAAPATAQDTVPPVVPAGEAPAASSVVVGFQLMTTSTGTEVGIWYPSHGMAHEMPLGPYRQNVAPGGAIAGHGLPLVVISHGNGGGFTSHVDTAEALARAGFVVAALTHPGDNWKDQSKATDMAARPRSVQQVITYMLEEWPGQGTLDPDKVGAFGFSSGGFTVLAAAGGKPDFQLMAPHCKAHPDFYDCKLIRANGMSSAPVWSVERDARIKALVVAAPALGFTFADQGLAQVTVPVQLWRADADEILPAPDYADAVRATLPTVPEFHTVPDAGHFDFLAPCNGPIRIPAICTSASGFDRTAFHARFNAAVVAFFSQTLG